MLKKKPKVKRSNSSTGKTVKKRAQKAEAKAVKKTFKYGPDSKKAKRAVKKSTRLNKKAY